MNKQGQRLLEMVINKAERLPNFDNCLPTDRQHETAAFPSILNLIGMRGDTFIALSFFDQILSADFLSNFPNFLKVKIYINQVILTPCPAY